MPEYQRVKKKYEDRQKKFFYFVCFRSGLKYSPLFPAKVARKMLNLFESHSSHWPILADQEYRMNKTLHAYVQIRLILKLSSNEKKRTH